MKCTDQQFSCTIGRVVSDPILIFFLITSSSHYKHVIYLQVVHSSLTGSPPQQALGSLCGCRTLGCWNSFEENKFRISFSTFCWCIFKLITGVSFCMCLQHKRNKVQKKRKVFFVHLSLWSFMHPVCFIRGPLPYSSSSSTPFLSLKPTLQGHGHLPDCPVTWPAHCCFPRRSLLFTLLGLLDEYMDERMDEYITKHFKGIDVFGNARGSRC